MCSFCSYSETQRRDDLYKLLATLIILLQALSGPLVMNHSIFFVDLPTLSPTVRAQFLVAITQVESRRSNLPASMDPRRRFDPGDEDPEGLGACFTCSAGRI